jgi:hypothetical protein
MLPEERRTACAAISLRREDHGHPVRVVVAAGVKSVAAKPRAKLATANFADPRSPKIVAKHTMPGRLQMAALCRRRASDWADAIRDGLDPDIARYIRDQAAAWRLLANTYAGCHEIVH